jgi:hypothetical protein
MICFLFKENTRKTNKWVENIKMDLGKRGSAGLDWIGLDKNGDKRRALLNTVMNPRAP